MVNKNISANEIKRQADRLELQMENFYIAASRIITNYTSMRYIVESEDSNLANVLAGYANSYIALHAKVKQKFSPLVAIMRDYANKTIVNEEETSIDVQALQQEIESITSNL